MTADRAERELTSWARRQRKQDQSRDELVRRAVAAGMAKTRIHELTGIARTTIDRIIKEGPDGS